jgi:hypothetical protein
VKFKPNLTYKYGFQIAPYIVLFQSQKNQKKFEKVCSMIKLGHLRVRKDGILEYVISRTDALYKFLEIVKPFVILKKEQVRLMLKILNKKEKIKNKKDFDELAILIERFRKLNYSKKRKMHILTP